MTTLAVTRRVAWCHGAGCRAGGAGGAGLDGRPGGGRVPATQRPNGLSMPGCTVYTASPRGRPHPRHARTLRQRWCRPSHPNPPPQESTPDSSAEEEGGDEYDVNDGFIADDAAEGNDGDDGGASDAGSDSSAERAARRRAKRRREFVLEDEDYDLLEENQATVGDWGVGHVGAGVGRPRGRGPPTHTNPPPHRPPTPDNNTQGFRRPQKKKERPRIRKRGEVTAAAAGGGADAALPGA